MEFSDVFLDPNRNFIDSQILLPSEHIPSSSMTHYYSLLKIRCSILTLQVTVSFFPAQGLIKITRDLMEIFPSSVFLFSESIHNRLNSLLNLSTMDLLKNIYFDILSTLIKKKISCSVGFFLNLSFKFSSHFQLSFFFVL